MQTPSRKIESTTSMLGDRRRDSASQNTVGISNLLRSVENLRGNVNNLSSQLEADRKGRIAFDDKRIKLLKKEEKSLEDLKAATLNFRKILGVAAGASAIRQFSQGNIGGGLAETGVAITAFLPEIIGITQNVVVGSLATKGLIGGGRGIGAAGAARGMGGRAGLLALPLLLAPLLMGGGRQNNQSNAPTAEFRREQETRRFRKDVILSNDTQRFSAQLDRFDRILSSFGKKEKTTEKLDLPVDIDDEPERNFNDRLSSFLKLLDPLRGTKKFFSNLFGIESREDQVLEDRQISEDLGFSGLIDSIRNALGLGGGERINPEFKGEIPKEFQDDDTSGFEAGAFTEVTDDEARRIIEEEDRLEKEDNEEDDEPFSDIRKILQGLAKDMEITEDGTVDFSSILGEKKGAQMSSVFSNFFNFSKGVSEIKGDDLEKESISMFSKVIGNIPEIKKDVLDDAPNFIQDVFGGMFNSDGNLEVFDEAKTKFSNESETAVESVFCDPRYKKSFDKFANKLILNCPE